MKNAETHTVKLKTILASKPFVQGFKDYTYNNGWHDPENNKDQWRYERGRLFAAFLKAYGVNLASYRLKAGKYATLQSIENYKHALREGCII